MMGAILEPIPTVAAAEPPPPIAEAAAPPVVTKPAPRPMRTMLGGGFEGIAELVKAIDAGAPLPAPPASALEPAASASADPLLPAPLPSAPLQSAPITPPIASSTAGLPLSPLADGPAPVARAAVPAAWGAQTVDARASGSGTAAPTPEAEPAIPRRQQMRTMLGAGLDFAPGAQAPLAPAHAAGLREEATGAPDRGGAVVLSADPSSPPPPVVAGSTIEGMPAPAAGPVVTAWVSPPSAPAGGTLDGVAPAPVANHARARTMIGMAAPILPAMQPNSAPAPAAMAPATPSPASPAAPAAAAPSAAPTVQSKRAAALGPSNRTMLGVAAPRAGVVPAGLGSAKDVAPYAQGPVTQPTVPLPAAATSTGDLSIAGLPSPRRRARGWLFALLFVGVMLVVSVIVAAVYYHMTRARTDVVASVGTSPLGEVLHAAVTGAPEGSHVRFSGVDLPLGAAGADFPLAAESLHVGDNVISIDVVFPDGTSEAHQVTLTVEYRIHADLASLTATPPAITVVIDAVPGSTVILDAQPFVLDAAGHGTRVCPIEGLAPASDGAIEHVAHYVITPPSPAVPATGALTTRVPVVTVHIDRPADGAVTDRQTVELSGAVSPGSTVTLDGAPATVTTEGRFLATVALATVGDHAITLVASAPGRVAASRTLHVRRVADLAREAAGFAVDRSLTYARIAAAPDALTGQHVAIEGRVYNVDLQDGHGVLQLLARDCPSGERCPLWVTYSAATEVTVESWVRVVGEVAGTQQFRSQAGEVRTVPCVDATFVLPARP